MTPTTFPQRPSTPGHWWGLMAALSTTPPRARFRRQVQLPVLEGETSSGVVHRRVGQCLLLQHRKPPALPHRQSLLNVFDGLGPGSTEVPNRLLLSDGRSIPQPLVRLSGLGQIFVQPGGATHFTGQPECPGSGHTLVPYPTVPIPLGQKQPFCGTGGSHPVGVAHTHLGHVPSFPTRCDMAS